MFDPDEIRAREIRRDIYRRMTPVERWQEACKLYQFAHDAKTAAIRCDHPDWDEEQINNKVREIFLYATT